MTISRLALAAAAAFGLSILPVLAKDKSGTGTPSETPPPISEQSATPPAAQEDAPPALPDADAPTPGLQDRLMSLNPQTLATLRDNFPNDLEALIPRFDGIVAAGGELSLEENLEAFALIIQEQRLAGVANVASASDDTLRPLYSNISAFLTKVLEQEGPEVCGDFAIIGSQALFNRDLAEKYAEDLDRTSSLFLAASASGRDDAVTRQPAGDTEYSAVFAKMVADGAPATQIDVIASVDGTNPELCPSLANMMSAMGTLEGEAGERSRATFARELVGY